MSDNNNNKNKIFSVIVERNIPMRAEYHVEAPNQEEMTKEIEEFLEQNDDTDAKIISIGILSEDADEYNQTMGQLLPFPGSTTIQ